MRFFSSVSSFVFDLPRCLHEAFPTEVAVELELLQMEVLVTVSRGFAVEYLSADGAHRRLAALLLVVDSDVVH